MTFHHVAWEKYANSKSSVSCLCRFQPDQSRCRDLNVSFSHRVEIHTSFFFRHHLCCTEGLCWMLSNALGWFTGPARRQTTIHTYTQSCSVQMSLECGCVQIEPIMAQGTTPVRRSSGGNQTHNRLPVRQTVPPRCPQNQELMNDTSHFYY